jgi:acyl-CoA synthetase (AMP-forming)/AMP-acid ligase II
MPGRSILDALRCRLEATPEAPFAHVVQGSRTEVLTNAALAAGAARWAGLLAADGCRPGDTVILMLRHGPALYTAFLGCVMAGCVPAFLPFPTPKQDPRLYWESHDTLLRRIGAACVVTYAENAATLRAMIPDVPYHLRVLGEEMAAEPLVVWRDGRDADIALLQHSSGTTGLKKGVALSHAAILAQTGLGLAAEFRLRAPGAHAPAGGSP